jgi:hypothetical protein
MRRLLTAAFGVAPARPLSHCLSARSRVALAVALVATSLAGGLAPAYASTVIAEVSGFTGGADQSPGNAISFTTTSGFTDVTISALLYTADFMTGSAATVYLTDKIGDGTTTANEIAKVSVTDLPGQFTTDTPAAVFTGLTLPAGTYYVIEASDAGPPGASWGGPVSPTETTAPGVTINSILQASSLAGYSPASGFVADSEFQFTLFRHRKSGPRTLDLGNDAARLCGRGLRQPPRDPRASFDGGVKLGGMRLMKAAA